jgi:hypothetical protein
MTTPTREPDPPPAAPTNDRPVRAGPLAVARAVVWSVLGIRRGRDLDRDVATITPGQVVVGGLIGAAVLVGGLVMLVRWIVATAG